MVRNLLLIALVLLFASSGFADTNGIWTYAKDIVPGTFGSDEGYGPFTFNGMVNFLQPVSFKNSVKVEGTLNVSSNSGRAIWAESSVDDGVAGVTSAAGKSAIYGWAKSSNAYSGYFEGGKFYVGSINITLASKLNCSKLYTDANGNVWCGVDQVNDADADPTNEIQVLNKSGNVISLSKGGGTITLNDDSPTNELQNLNSVLARGNNAGGRRITNVANPINPKDVATKDYVDSIASKNVVVSSEFFIKGSSSYNLGKWDFCALVYTYYNGAGRCHVTLNADGSWTLSLSESGDVDCAARCFNFK